MQALRLEAELVVLVTSAIRKGTGQTRVQMQQVKRLVEVEILGAPQARRIMQDPQVEVERVVLVTRLASSQTLSKLVFINPQIQCNQEGHWANACPNAETTNQTRSFGGSAANLPGKSASSKSICHKCNQSGHFSSKCPNVSDSKPTKGRGSGRGRGSRGGGRGKGRGKTTAQTKSGFSIPAGFDY
uniref:Putative prokaryotic type I DNA topoisomerase n=1 Tax=Moniliophthora roreri TaxID=221103 RepID=A0A0W0EX13_MONRR